MPFVNADSRAPAGLDPRAPSAEPGPRPDFLSETLPAAFRSFNTVAAAADAARSFGTPQGAEQAGYDPFDHIAGYEPFASSFIAAEGPEDVARLKAKIDRELSARTTVAAAGWQGMAAGLAAGLVDPVNLIPVGGSVVEAGRLGQSVLRSAGTGARAGLVTGAAQEVVMHGLQETRTFGESLADIGFTTVLAGALGSAAPLLRAGAGALRDGRAIGELYERPHAAPEARTATAAGEVDGLADLTARARRDLAGPPAGGLDPLEPGFVRMAEPGSAEHAVLAPVDAAPGGSVGAKAVRDSTLAEETLKGALGLEKAVAFQDPMLRAVTSPSVEARRVMRELSEVPLVFEKNAAGIASPVAATTRIKMWDAPLARAVSRADDLFVRHRLQRERQSGDVLKIGLGDAMGRREAGALGYLDFRTEVGRALRRGDQHEIPEVAEAAQFFRREVFDPLKDRAIKAGLLPADVKAETAASYLTRVYDVPRIVARRNEFEGRLVNWLADLRSKAGLRLRELEGLKAKHESAAVQLDAEHANLEGEYRLAEADWKKARDGAMAAERDILAARRELRQAEREVSEAAARRERFQPTADLERSDPLASVLKDLRRGGPKPPPSLSDWVRKSGGLRDEGGEASALGLGDHRLVNAKSGMTLEDAARRAREAGYFSGHAEDEILLDDFLVALRDDAAGVARMHRDEDLVAVAYRDYLGAFAAEMDRHGIALDLPDAKIKAALDAAIAGGEARFREATPAARAKAMEIGYYHRRAAERHGQAGKRLATAEARLGEMKGLREVARQDMSAALARRENTAGELRKATAARDKAARTFDSEKVFAGMEDVELRDVATQMTDHVIGASPARALYEPVPLTRGPLRERTLGIADYAIEDFLESDVETVARIYARTMAPDVELATAFGRADMQDQLDKIGADYARLRVGVTDEATLRQLDKRMRADLRDVAAVRDRVRGTYALPSDPSGFMVRAAHLARNWNYLRLMGGMTLASIADAGRAVMVHGVNRVVGDGLAPMVANFRGFKLAAKEAELAGTALDMVLDNRAMQLSEIWDDYGRLSKFERGVSALTHRFGLVSLMAPWNTAMKQFAAVVTQSRMLEAAELVATKAGRAREREYLAFLGIDAPMAERIAAEFAANGERQKGGVMWANTQAWADREAVGAFRAALVKDVDRIIVTPGQDKPLWMSTELGKLVGQFKSFSLASTQRVALAGLQQRDAAALNGTLLSVGLGMLSYAATSGAAGRPLSESPATWIHEGFDRSGVLFWLSDVNSIGGKLFGIGGATPSRMGSRSAAEALLGPTLGTGLDTGARVVHAAASGDWAAGDTRALRRLVPYQNLFYLRRLFDAAEEGVNEALGVPTRVH